MHVRQDTKGLAVLLFAPEDVGQLLLRVIHLPFWAKSSWATTQELQTRCRRAVCVSKCLIVCRKAQHL